MTPAILIATHNRKQITTENISLLLKQVTKQQIVLVVSNSDEAEYYHRIGVNVCVHPNEPLGAKWQHGVGWIKKNIGCTHLIITGSDDILCKDFIKRFCTGEKFLGLQRWYIWSEGLLYLFDYLPRQCLGGGRVYRTELLDAYGWQVFKPGINKLLDDHGWEITNPSTRRIIKDEGCILAVKGDWEVMNKVNIHHKNVKLLHVWQGAGAAGIMLEKFGYEV